MLASGLLWKPFNIFLYLLFQLHDMNNINPGTIFFFFIIASAMGLPIPLMVFAFVAFIIFKTATANQNDPNNPKNPTRRNSRRRQRDYDRKNRGDYRQQESPRREYQRPANRPAPAPKKNPFKVSGVEKYKDYDYDGAIEDFIKALQINPNDIAVHFNLACAYSLTEEKDKAFHHLDKAVALGFSDVEKIKTHDALAYIRIQDDFLDFEKNNYRMVNKASGPGNILESQNLLEQLKKLAELREQGLLTEEEFVLQKKKLLR